MLKSRKYQPNDEIQINNLYKLLTGIERNFAQYSWEWLENPYKKESIWVIVDDENKKEKIIGHHGLIPTPLYIMGKSLLAGRTENTMLHPDYRGRGIYFPFEKRFCEEAKDMFQLLFTVSGRGAAGRIREKLDYHKLGSWDNYYYFLDFKKQMIIKKLSKEDIYYLLLRIPFLLRLLFTKIRRFFKKDLSFKKKFDIYVTDSNIESIKEIEKLWLKNKKYFYNTIDRKKEYLIWRIHKNPYHEHKFIILKKSNRFLGYLILQLIDQKYAQIVDILVDKKDPYYFEVIFDACIEWAKKEKLDFIVFPVLEGNKTMENALKKNSFISTKSFNRLIGLEQPFYLQFFSDSKSKKMKAIYDLSRWYITGLTWEGR